MWQVVKENIAGESCFTHFQDGKFKNMFCLGDSDPISEQCGRAHRLIMTLAFILISQIS